MRVYSLFTCLKWHLVKLIFNAFTSHAYRLWNSLRSISSPRTFIPAFFCFHVGETWAIRPQCDSMSVTLNWKSMKEEKKKSSIGHYMCQGMLWNLIRSFSGNLSISFYMCLTSLSLWDLCAHITDKSIYRWKHWMSVSVGNHHPPPENDGNA